MRSRVFLTLCLLILVNQFGFGMITPVLPAYARSFGVSASAVGFVIGIFGLARFLANMPAGQVAERRGRRTVLIAGTVVNTAAAALIATAMNLPQLLLYRLLSGLGAAAVLTGGQVMVSDIATPDNRGRMMSMYQGFFLVGVGLGPAPGGILADHLGIRAPFIAYTLFSAAACGLALVLIRETKPQATERPFQAAVPDSDAGTTGAERLRDVSRGVPFLLIGAVSFAQVFGRTGALFTMVPLLGQERIGLSASQIGYTLTVVNVLNLATLYHAGTLADRFGRKWIVAPATLISGLAAVTFALSGSYAAFVLAAAVWGVGSGFAGPVPAAYVADLAPPHLRGQVFGMYRSVADSGYVIGPLLLGWLADVSGYTAPLLLSAGLFLLSGTLFALFAPELHRVTKRQPLPAGESGMR